MLTYLFGTTNRTVLNLKNETEQNYINNRPYHISLAQIKIKPNRELNGYLNFQNTNLQILSIFNL